MHARIALLSMTLMAFAGCHEANRPERPAEGAEVPILRSMSGPFSHEDRAMQVVVRDAATLAQLPLTDVKVDFDKEILLVVTLGRRLSDRYTVKFNRVWVERGEMRVDYSVVAPPADSPMVLASPYAIAVIPRNDMNVRGFSATVGSGRRNAVPDVLRERRDIPQ